MLESLTATNFQCHRNRTIEFDPLCTTLVGSSDSGKSSIIRLLRWIAFNRPRGDGFLTHGQESVSGELVVDGRRIIRTRGKQVNGYRLDSDHFAAFATGVPEPVSKLLNVNEDITFSFQHAQPFWMFLTAGGIAKELNQVVSLDLIDESLSRAARATKDAKTTVVATEARLSQAREQERNTCWAVQVDKSLASLEERETDLEQERHRLRLLRSLVEEGQRATKAVQAAQNASQALEKAVALGQAAIEARTKARTLRELINKCTEYTKVKAPPDLSELHDLMADVSRAQSRKVALASILRTYREQERELCDSLKARDEAIQNLNRAVGNQCPLCRQPVEGSLPSAPQTGTSAPSAHQHGPKKNGSKSRPEHSGK